MKTLFYAILCGLLLSSGAATAQTDSSFLNRALTLYDGFIAAHPFEKVYVQQDKPYYNPGDTLWFKAYTVVGPHHQLSALSGILTVELIGPMDSVLQRMHLLLNAGVAWNNFNLPRNYKAGNYRIRAYTRWMQNDSEFLFDRPFSVSGIAATHAPLSAETIALPDVQFFPEGGSLINGVRSRVAIKVTDKSGYGEDMKGYVMDSSGDTVAAVATQHLGMGVFALLPQSGKTYMAKLTGNNGQKLSIPLPAAADQGFTLAVNYTGQDSIYVKVAVNNSTLAARSGTSFYIIGESAGKIYFVSKGQLISTGLTSVIASNRFPSGIARFTLFSQEGLPLCERVTFIRSRDTLSVAVSSAAQKYATRQKVAVHFVVKNGDGQPVTGTFSAAVVNESRIGMDIDRQSNIMSALLLNDDLKGYIENAGYYFNHTAQSNADLDVLMLTQGYRRFAWKTILKDSAMEKLRYQPQKSLEIGGLLKTASGKPVPKGSITLLASKENLVLDTVTDVAGRFLFTNINLADTSKLILRARKANNGSNVSIYVQQPEYPPVNKIVPVSREKVMMSKENAVAMRANFEDYQKQLRQDSLRNGVPLIGVKITAKRTAKPDRFNNYGTSPEVFVNMHRLLTEFTSLKEGLLYSVPGLKFTDGHFVYEGHGAVILIDGLDRDGDAVDYYYPKEIDNIRMISPFGKSPAYIIVTSKTSAGTDTASTQLKQVNIKSNRVNKGQDLAGSANLNGPGNADQVIMGDKLSSCIRLSDCLQGRIAGVAFRSDGTPYSIRSQNRFNGQLDMVIILDGAQLPGSALNDINVNDVNSIEVLKSKGYVAVYGSNAGGGALVITTKRASNPDYVTSASPAGLIAIPFKGYHLSREFYSPVYNAPQKYADVQDLRSTIYWKPNILTDKDGKASMEFYNADTKGTYRVVIEGIDDDGNLGRQAYRYKVE
jgi:hypothetical protein